MLWILKSGCIPSLRELCKTTEQARENVKHTR